MLPGSGESQVIIEATHPVAGGKINNLLVAQEPSTKADWIKMCCIVGLTILAVVLFALFFISLDRAPKATGPVTELPLRFNNIKIIGEPVITIQPEIHSIDEKMVTILLHMPSQKMIFDDNTVITEADVHVHRQNSTFLTTLSGNPMHYMVFLSYDTQGVADYGIGPFEKRVIGYNFRATTSSNDSWEQVFFERTFLISVDDEDFKKRAQKALESRQNPVIY